MITREVQTGVRMCRGGNQHQPQDKWCLKEWLTPKKCQSGSLFPSVSSLCAKSARKWLKPPKKSNSSFKLWLWLVGFSVLSATLTDGHHQRMKSPVSFDYKSKWLLNHWIHRTKSPILNLFCVSSSLSTVAMYLGIKKGKIKTVNPAPSDSLGVWGPPAPWSLVISCGRFARCSMPTTATTNSKRVSCFFASTGTGEPKTWSSGRWRFASCPVSPSTASGSNGYPDHPSLSKTLLPKLPTS